MAKSSLSKNVSPVYNRQLTKREFDTLSLDSLDESRRNQIMNIKNTVTELIGGTPLLELKHLEKDASLSLLKRFRCTLKTEHYFSL